MTLGPMSLRPHQVVAVGRLLEIIRTHRGALLGDAVGLGKTYVAIAVARNYSRPLVVCPAALKTMWERAMKTTGEISPVMSIEALSRGEGLSFQPDLVVVDEAHHFRNPRTRRYDAVASLARRAHMLLLSATPLQNSRNDVAALLALFVGLSVHGWTDSEIARLVVRRDEHAATEVLPPVEATTLAPAADDDCLELICDLPSVVPAVDEGSAEALAILSTVHLWSSSRAALRASLRKRRARAIALFDAVGSGHLPTASELTAWEYADDALQLAFPFCASGTAAPLVAADLMARLDRHIAAVNRLLVHCERGEDPDMARVRLLRVLRARHPDERIVAFSQYAQTIAGLARLMRADPGVASITGNGARIAAGFVTRQEVMEQFALDSPDVSASQRIDLLLSTDLLSEGVDLRGAAIIVHLDLPWNPARLEQRVGRTRRLGSRHEKIHVYTFVPPAAAERMLTLERRLKSKLTAAARMIGGSPLTFLSPAPAAEQASPVRAAEEMRARMTRWLDSSVNVPDGAPAIACASAKYDGWIAAVQVRGVTQLIHCVDGRIGDDPRAMSTLVEHLGDASDPAPGTIEAALSEIGRWAESRLAVCRLAPSVVFPSPQRAVLERLSRSLARAPRHRRPALAAMAHRARLAVAGVTGVGAERLLEQLARSNADDESWLHSLDAFGAIHSRADPQPTTANDGIFRVLALILMRARPEQSVSVPWADAATRG